MHAEYSFLPYVLHPSPTPPQYHVAGGAGYRGDGGAGVLGVPEDQEEGAEDGGRVVGCRGAPGGRRRRQHPTLHHQPQPGGDGGGTWS